MKLYHHKTDGGAEYLTDKYTVCPSGEHEGRFTMFLTKVEKELTALQDKKQSKLQTMQNIGKIVDRDFVFKAKPRY